MVDTKLYETLKKRGLLYQCTDEEGLKKMLESGKPITLYEGTDPTADSLHIGHCVPYCILRRFQKAGHKVILLMGGATAQIGDPSGKSELRKVMDTDTISANIEKIKNSLKIFLDFEGENKAIIVNNADWFKNLSYIDFMRDIGIHFNVNKMLSSEIYDNRLNQGGLTFFEMGYMPMQAYDFIELNKKYGCTLQYGGGDQWANIVAGVELQRKLNFLNGTDVNLIGATNPLLLTPDGKKMGKTEKGAIWIDRDKISAYDFYQGVYQTPDECTRMMFALFTDVDMDEVDKLISQDIVNAKKTLAYEITKFVRGEEDAIIAQEATKALFENNGNLDNAPTFAVDTKTLEDGIDTATLFTMCGLCSSKSEVRRLCQQSVIMVKDQKILYANEVVDTKQLKDGYILLKKGKKNFMKIVTK